MKNVITLLALIFLWTVNAVAQQPNIAEGTKMDELPMVYLTGNVSIHFVSPEAIQCVDISTKSIVGDFPLKNVLRIKSIVDSTKKNNANIVRDAVITITGETFIAQYHVVFGDNLSQRTQTKIDVLPEHTRPLDISGLKMSQNTMKEYAMRLISKRAKGHWAQSKYYGITARLNSIYTVDDYIFLDLGYENETNLKYDVDQVRFTIEDRKVNKASTVQSIEVKPDFVLFNPMSFKKHSRNVYVFKKFTFPGNKVLKAEMNEKQVSGRVSTLLIKYSDVLDADMIPSN